MNKTNLFSWKDFVPSFLAAINSRYINRLNIKKTILIVEGFSDYNFYSRLFKKSFIFVDGVKKTLNGSSSSIVFNFCNSGDIGGVGSIILGDWYRVNDLKRLYSSIPSTNHKEKEYEFVAECIRYYEKHNDQFKYSYLWGFIDRDFGHDDLIKTLNNISSTDMHDRETALIRYFMPLYFKDIKNKERALEIFSKIIIVCFKQGLLEKTSHEFCGLADERKTKLYKKITKYFFDDFKNDLTLFNFNEYIDNYFDCKYNKFNEDEVNILRFEHSKFKKFLVFTFNTLQEKYDFTEENIKKLLRCWLIDKEIGKIEDEKLNLIFSYCNGHLITKLTEPYREFFNKDVENDFITNLINEVINNRECIDYLLCKNPIEQYKQFKIDKNDLDSIEK